MDRPNWDEYFMNIADIIKSRSPDTKTKVGSVLVSKNDHRIISTGYNGLPQNMDDKNIDWNNRDDIRNKIIHAEANALLYAQSKFEDAVLYCTLSPCCNCLKLLSAAKIKKIIYKDQYRDIDLVKDLCKYFDIELIQYQ